MKKNKRCGEKGIFALTEKPDCGKIDYVRFEPVTP